MQQLNTILLAPTSVAQNSTLDHGGIANTQLEEGDAQKFASHLSKLTEQLDQQGLKSDSRTAQQTSAEQAVSDLVRTIRLSVDHEEMPADDAWLSMVEELNAVAEGEASLAQVSSRHGIDNQALKAQLDQALAEFDGDVQALTVELQKFSSGKALPLTAPEQNRITIAEPGPLEDVFEKLVTEEDVEAILDRVAQLPAPEQMQFATEVSALLSKLKQLQGKADGTQPQDFITPILAPDTEQTIELQELSDSLKKQLHNVLANTTELTEQEQAHLRQQLTLLEQLDDLPLHNILGEQQSAQQLADSISTDSSAAKGANNSAMTASVETEMAGLLSKLQSLFTDIESEAGQHPPLAEDKPWLQQVDIRALEKELSRLLNVLENEFDGVKPSELMATLETQLQVLKAQELTASDSQGEPNTKLAQLNQLLTELNIKLESTQADMRVLDGSRVVEPGSKLPLVAQALSLASNELKVQLQQALQAQQSGGIDADENLAGEFDNLRRLLSEGATHGAEQRNTTSQSQLGNGLQSALQSSQVTPMQGNGLAREQAASRAADAPVQSGFEAARQAQQAIDILGTGGTERLRERVSLMFNSRTQAAEMRLDPPDLGRLSIRLNMNQEQATVSFQVTTPQAREALEQSLPRLRELLAEQGIALADANVSEQQQEGSQQAFAGEGQQAQVGESGLSESDFDSEAEIEVESSNAVVNGRVDYFV